MITASFSANRNLKKVIPKGSVTLVEANKQLAIIETYAIEHQISENGELILSRDGKTIFKDDVEFGAGHAYVQSILSLVNHTLETVFEGTPPAQKEALISLISNGLNEVDNSSADISATSDKDSMEPKPTTPPVHEDIEPEDANGSETYELTRTNYQLKTRQSRGGKRVAFHFHLPKFQIPHMRISLSKRLIKIVMSIVLIIVVGWASVFAIQLVKQHKNELPTYSSLISDKDYVKAAKLYPDKKVKIEQYLFDNKKIDDLKKFNSHYPTDNGKYDIAFYQKEWDKMLKVKGVRMTRVRKAQLVVAYLKTHRPDDAYRLNMELGNTKLTQSIALEFIRNGQIDKATEINQTLKSGDLTDLINAGKSYQQVIEKYQGEVNDPGLSEAQRKDAADNLKVWQRNLKTLGE